MNSIDLNSFNNSDYNPGAGMVKRLMWYCINTVFYKSSWCVSSEFKIYILKKFGARIGKGVIIKPCVNIKNPWFLAIGDNCWVGENVWIDNLTKIEIKSNVCISQGALLLTGNHNYKKSSFDLIVGQIVLEEGVWIGAKSVVCPGVNCKSHSILSVGSIATRDLDSYMIYQGNPAKKIRKRSVSV